MAEDSDAVIERKLTTGDSILHLVTCFAKHASVVAVVYLLGYFNLSIAWLICPVILSVLRVEWKKEKELKRKIAKEAAQSSEKEFILARVDDLPAWVFFPDIERAEWINKMLSQFWPNVNHYAKVVIQEKIEPAILESLRKHQLGFSFQKMLLGTIAPRIGGIKVYDTNISRNEIIMDMDLFYAGDCDICFKLGGLLGGIKDFQIRGKIRVGLKPLIRTLPLFGGLQIYFRNIPTIDFNLVGVADLLNMPGLSDMLRRTITEQVAKMMVLPNKISIILSKDVPAHLLKFPEPEGILRVHVVEAKELMKKDFGILSTGKSDPYAILKSGAESFRTQTIPNTLEPKWDYWCEFCVTSATGQNFVALVFDKDKATKDEPLGRAKIDILGVTKKGQLDTWVSLEEAITGMLHLRMTWLQLTNKQKDLRKALLETQHLQQTSMSTAVLMVFLDSANNLPCSGGTSGGPKPNPLCVLSVANKIHESTVQHGTHCPVYEQSFIFLVNNPETDTLKIKFVDQKSGRADLGTLAYDLSILLDKENLEFHDQPFQLRKSGPESNVVLSMRLRILKCCESSADMDDPPKQEDEGISNSPLIREPSIKSEHLVISEKEDLENRSEELYHECNEVISPNLALSKVETLPESLHQRQESTISSSGENGHGKIKITLRYSHQRQRLEVCIHKIENLSFKDHSNISDLYVKLYLLPERNKESKRKTVAVRDNCHPVYDESFVYVMSQGELSNRKLEITILGQKTWKSTVLGLVVINLNEMDLTTAQTLWFDIQPEAVKEKN